MAASTIHGRHHTGHNEGLQATQLSRDLGQIAELIELCFSAQMDAGGRSAVREMKMLSSLGPLLWPLTLFNGTAFGLGLGYVWREGGRVIGNVSLYRGGRHPWLGPGFLIANVAVLPEYRRRGIARAMMIETLRLAQQKQGRWVSLQVEADNAGAIALYRELGFEQLETISQWTTGYFRPTVLPTPHDEWPVRIRRRGEVDAEMDLIYNRARVGAIAWTRPIAQGAVQEMASNVLLGTNKEHWGVFDPDDGGRLLGVLWIDVINWVSVRLTLFFDPALEDPNGRRALLSRTLRLAHLQGRRIQIETAAHDDPVDEVLISNGFRKVRTLVLMRKQLED
ncbi:MAG: GNAT family N-acetyltransferase [Anaerolineae bacterium]|nr:GNAT family N-acetyltransferase [Anaerolineae bacterium]